MTIYIKQIKQMSKLRFREVKGLDKGHTAGQGQS